METENQNKKSNKIWLIILIVIVIICLAIIAILAINNKSGSKSPIEKIPVQQTDDNQVATNTEAEIVDPYKQEVEEDIAVPELDEEISEEKKDIIAVPKTVTEAAPGVSAKYRRFEIRGESDKFIPSEIIVNKGDTVHIDFTAIDKDYDIRFPSYGMKQTAKLGEKKILEFQANQAGKFLYYCELCGGEGGEVSGYINVVE